LEEKLGSTFFHFLLIILLEKNTDSLSLYMEEPIAMRWFNDIWDLEAGVVMEDEEGVEEVRDKVILS
jgi:hypothetical protein